MPAGYKAEAFKTLAQTLHDFECLIDGSPFIIINHLDVRIERGGEFALRPIFCAAGFWLLFARKTVLLFPPVCLSIIIERSAGKAKKRRKTGSLGKRKGTDALRREKEGLATAAATRMAGLTKSQQTKFHQAMAGKFLTFRQLVEEAKKFKYGK